MGNLGGWKAGGERRRKSFLSCDPNQHSLIVRLCSRRRRAYRPLSGSLRVPCHATGNEGGTTEARFRPLGAGAFLFGDRATMATSGSGTVYFVRRATLADTDAILFVWRETAEMLARGDSRYRLAPNAAECWQADLQNWLKRDDVAVFVAESTLKPGHVLGYIVGSVVSNVPTLKPGNYGYVSDLAVDSHGKAGGIGRNLFDALKGL